MLRSQTASGVRPEVLDRLKDALSMLGMLTVTLDGAVGGDAFALPAGAEFRFVRVVDVSAFTQLLSEGVPAGYIVTSRLNCQTQAMVSRVQLSVPGAHLVVGVVDAENGDAQSAIAGDRTALICPLPDPAALCFLGRRAWFGARIEMLRRHSDSRTPHWLVRRAIHTVLSARFELGDASAQRRLRPVRNVRDLAARCGASEKTLRRYCREHGVVVGTFISDWKAMLAVWARLLGGRGRPTAWARVARHLGYRDESGVRKLLTRTLSHSVEPGALCLSDLQGLFERLESSLGEGPETPREEA